MKIDIEQFKADGVGYTNTLIETFRNEAWENLKFAKFQTSSSEELELMEHIWTHGFGKGSEVSTTILSALKEALAQTTK